MLNNLYGAILCFFNFMFKKKKKTGPHLLTLFRSMLQKRFVDTYYALTLSR